jgi:RimJ/RimL family protein N-acetyltransferase
MPHFPALPLQTERLTLRPYRADDAEAVFAIFSDPRVMRYWSTPPWTSTAQADEAIESDLRALDSGRHLRLGIERRDDGALIGQCTLFDLVAACRRAEMGYALAHAAWGRGYMHEALQALLRYGFELLDLNRVEADIDPRNTASASTLLRLGFRLEGLLRERWVVDGEVSDSAIYGLLRREWDQRRAAR